MSSFSLVFFRRVCGQNHVCDNTPPHLADLGPETRSGLCITSQEEFHGRTQDPWFWCGSGEQGTDPGGVRLGGCRVAVPRPYSSQDGTGGRGPWTFSATERPEFAAECSEPWQGWGSAHEDQPCSREHGASRGPTTKAQEGRIHLASCQPGGMVIKDQARHLARDSDTAPGIAGDVWFVFHQLAKEVKGETLLL